MRPFKVKIYDAALRKAQRSHAVYRSICLTGSLIEGGCWVSAKVAKVFLDPYPNREICPALRGSLREPGGVGTRTTRRMVTAIRMYTSEIGSRIVIGTSIPPGLHGGG